MWYEPTNVCAPAYGGEFNVRASLKDLRRDLATQYLADDGVSISQIAWLLGYQGAGAFTNAFKHWTGQTPRQVRFELHRP
jgi:AraC-like DNA-binding protein